MVTLKQARKRAGYTQGEVAEIVGVDHVTVSNWETGRTSPTAKRLVQLCQLYRVGIGELDFRKEVKSNGDNVDRQGAGGLGGRDPWEDGPED